MRREPARARQKPGLPPAPTVRLLLQDIAEGIRVLQTRDGVLLSNEQILERARNIVTGLLGNYRIRSLETREIRGRLPMNQMDLSATAMRNCFAGTRRPVPDRSTPAPTAS